MYTELLKKPILDVLSREKNFPLLLTSSDLVNMVGDEWGSLNIGFGFELNKIAVGRAMKALGFTPYRNDMRRGWLIKSKEEVKEKCQSK